MHLIIPMSGQGTRFKQEGYNVIKPMINVFGRSMVERVIDCFPGIEHITLIVNEQHDEDFGISAALSNDITKVITVRDFKLGPVRAVLQAEELHKIVTNEPTIVNYCDFWQLWNFEAFKEFVAKENPDGVVVCWTGFHPHMLNSTRFAYVRSEGSKVLQVREKESFTDDPMSELASTGTYYFKSGRLMLNMMHEQMSRGVDTNGEFYASIPFQLMVERELNVQHFEVDKFVCWGNPLDYEEFTYAAEAFRRVNTREILPDTTLIMPIGGLGKRFTEAGYTVPKAMIPVDDIPMFEAAINALPRCDTTVVTIKGSEIEVPPCYDHVELETQTKGQAETCYLAIKKREPKNHIMIGACDHANYYDEYELKRLINDEAVDFVVFGTRGYSNAIKKPASYAWIDADAAGHIKSIVTKKILKNPQTDWLLTGAFWFRSAEVFVKAAERLFAKNDTVNDEFYVDQAINHAIALGYDGRVLSVDYFVPWGTPEELKTYEFWKAMFDDYGILKPAAINVPV
jgi:NDP-sugar pyrophosphorylase family protein